MDLMGNETPSPTHVIVFEATEMGCQLFSHVLNGSSYGAKVLGCWSGAHDFDASLAHSADVALISVNLKDGPGAGFIVLRALKRYNSSLHCVMLFERDDPNFIVEAFRCGASGVCEREDSCESLCKCIYQVHRGQIWANTQQLHYLLQALTAETLRVTHEVREPIPLTKREEEVVALVVAGHRNRDIAERLGLSQHTIKNHLFRVFEKLGVASRSELIALFVQKKRHPSAQGPLSTPLDASHAE
jgi:DNA-binding NarL/FixJ family response regulator